MRIVVVLPAPLGPRKPKTSPCSTAIVTSSMPRSAAVELGQPLGLDRRHEPILAKELRVGAPFRRMGFMAEPGRAVTAAAC